ncbi:NAD(P)-dependent oxidoreductase [Fodinibius salsisoli]|uniref:NAD(P)H-binding protein n=1 Tax=Fodinibius salsisoli TaxID=2820877 RepID=A0ABT3PHQ9_9BACT|nr:NAD(P)H-binding protein [Fodinibius salsisoli]MCW9705447.1 NAD(P)H-binding protein [Fodinibius salsisoli]
MKIAIIGASGFVGSALVQEAIRRNHKITAIARNADKIDDKNELVTAVSVDATNVDDLADVLEGHDAVLSSFNAGWENPNLYEDYLSGSKAIQEATKKANVKRYLVIGGAGSLYNESGEQLVDQPDFPEEWKEGAKSARDYLTYLRKEEQLKWTFLSPAILMHPGIDTGRTGNYRIGTEHPVFDDNGESKISAEDLAVAFLDELKNEDYINDRFTVAY